MPMWNEEVNSELPRNGFVWNNSGKKKNNSRTKKMHLKGVDGRNVVMYQSQKLRAVKMEMR